MESLDRVAGHGVRTPLSSSDRMESGVCEAAPWRHDPWAAGKRDRSLSLEQESCAGNGARVEPRVDQPIAALNWIVRRSVACLGFARMAVARWPGRKRSSFRRKFRACSIARSPQRSRAAMPDDSTDRAAVPHARSPRSRKVQARSRRSKPPPRRGSGQSARAANLLAERSRGQPFEPAVRDP